MKWLLSWAVLFTATCGLMADDVTSGPKVGDKVEDFMAYGVVGVIDGKEGSYLKERKNEPTIYVFVRADVFNRPTAQFLKGLDTALKDSPQKAAVVAIWLTDKLDASKDYLPKANMSLNFVNTSLGVFGDKSGPKNWGINPDAYVTSVAVKNGQVTSVNAYLSVNGTDARKVIAEFLKEPKKEEPKKELPKKETPKKSS